MEDSPRDLVDSAKGGGREGGGVAVMTIPLVSIVALSLHVHQRSYCQAIGVIGRLLL